MASMCAEPSLYLQCFNCWYVRKVCSPLSIIKYWQNTPLCVRLGFVNDIALLNQQPLDSKQNCLLHMQKCRDTAVKLAWMKSKAWLANQKHCLPSSWALSIAFSCVFKIIFDFCALGQGLADYTLNMISMLTLFIWSYIFIHTGKCLAGYNVNYQTVLIIYICVLLWP